MPVNRFRILILAVDAHFRETLENVCSEIGETVMVSNVESALNYLTKKPFQLLLLDWHLNLRDIPTLYSNIESFQSQACRIALFTLPDLPSVVAAMKSGASDILWAGQEKRILREKIKKCLTEAKP